MRNRLRELLIASWQQAAWKWRVICIWRLKYIETIKGNRVLDDISASMECGKIYGFRGQNGSGKTMLMRCICGLVIPDNGAIIVDGDELGKEYHSGKSWRTH